ncbi:MAG: hypothetical protein K6D03_02655, partial [Solobacterium sp.]|nr:hypothetical protein [Solobacterium sp.]
MNYASRIREEIFNTKSIEDDSVFFSLDSFYSYLRSVFDVALGELAAKRRFTFDFICDPAGSETACTDSSVIRLNVAGPLVRSLTGRPQKYFS